MKIVTKRVFNDYGDVDIIIFKQGEYQTPIAILNEIEAKELANDINRCLDGVKSKKFTTGCGYTDTLTVELNRF